MAFNIFFHKLMGYCMTSSYIYTIVSACIPLTTFLGSQNYFMCLLAICLSSLQKCIFKSFVIFSFLFLEEFLTSLECKSLTIYMISKYFVTFYGLSVHFLGSMLWSTQNFAFIFMSSNSLFSFVVLSQSFLELTFICLVRKPSQFILLGVNTILGNPLGSSSSAVLLAAKPFISLSGDVLRTSASRHSCLSLAALPFSLPLPWFFCAKMHISFSPSYLDLIELIGYIDECCSSNWGAFCPFLLVSSEIPVGNM